jgi:hypothetical protein
MVRSIRIFAVAALCISSYAMAASPSIGTVTARGETRIDNYTINRSGTLFDGSVIETVGAYADLRLANDGAVVTMYANSLGTVHTDHFLLKRGIIKLSSSNSFNVQADDLVVVPAGDSSALVTIEDNNSVVVEAEKGTLEVRNAAGTPVAQVHPGSPLSFTWTGKSSSGITATGAVPSRNNQHDLPTVDANLIPSVLTLSGLSVSAQTSSQLGSMGARSFNSGGGCGGGQVQGNFGGCCTRGMLTPCCFNPVTGQNTNPALKCCPGFPATGNACGPSH